jgi:pSer/pThr/pTyr-binding forkhead associated (FHA) protein
MVQSPAWNLQNPGVMSGVRAYYHREQRWIDLPQGELIVGRNSCCDCQLDDDSVSGRHFRLVIDHGAIRVQDLESTNGTRVNGQPIEERTWTLSPGDRLQAGRVVFVIQTSPVRRARAMIQRYLRRRHRQGPNDLAQVG